MTIFSLVQAFLISMILGVVVFHSKIGSSPFMLIRDVLSDPIFKTNPNFVPADGTGLNPLLQNYWMVIHPPTLFLGFALTIVPFSYAIASLWRKKYTEWIKPVLPWALLGTGILGIGILMGAYWAYVTLNFGGYWNWDPVENAIFVPWLILVAAVHAMLIFKKKGTSLKLVYGLVISLFLLILYSTFLTRSGILGNTSVHSFTDLGLSGQLLIYLLAFMIISFGFLFKRWNRIPSKHKDMPANSGEFWIVLGIITLCLSGFQVIIPTSIPVFNEVAKFMGIHSNMAPPASQAEFYSKFQIWFAIAIAILSGTAQIFWWKRVNRKNFFDEISIPIILTFIAATGILLAFKMKNIPYMLMITAGLYSIIANGRILLKVMRSKTSVSGGTLAHVGLALMIIGILTSSGYSKVISLNNTGLLYRRDFPDEINKENLLLFIHEPRQMGDYRLTYEGKRIEAKGVDGFISRNQVTPTPDPHFVVASEDIMDGKMVKVKKGDTLEINPENTYYSMLYEKPDGESFRLYPRLQVNPNMGNVVSPSIRHSLLDDIYTHVTVVADEDPTWANPVKEEVKVGDDFYIKDHVAEFSSMERIFEVNGEKLSDNDVAVKAHIIIHGNGVDYKVNPIYMIRGSMAARIPDENKDFGVKINISKITPGRNSFTFEVSTSEKDFVILKAVEKPLINILWLGTFILMTGVGIALSRRVREYRKSST